MAALGDTYTYTDLETGNKYEFTCINLNPEYWICPTPFYDDWLVDNFGKKDEDGNAYYTINSYKACLQIEDVINHIDQSFHSTATFSNSGFLIDPPKLLTYLNNIFSISKILLNNKIYLKAIIKNTDNKSIIFPALGFSRDGKTFCYNQACFFTFCHPFGTSVQKSYTNAASIPVFREYDVIALYSTCLSTVTTNACIEPFVDDIRVSYIERPYTLCSISDTALNLSEIQTPVFIYAHEPFWA